MCIVLQVQEARKFIVQHHKLLTYFVLLRYTCITQITFDFSHLFLLYVLPSDLVITFYTHTTVKLVVYIFCLYTE
jgi:hypothetical protein